MSRDRRSAVRVCNLWPPLISSSREITQPGFEREITGILYQLPALLYRIKARYSTCSFHLNRSRKNRRVIPNTHSGMRMKRDYPTIYSLLWLLLLLPSSDLYPIDSIIKIVKWPNVSCARVACSLTGGDNTYERNSTCKLPL